jgi:hypothetical protein
MRGPIPARVAEPRRPQDNPDDIPMCTVLRRRDGQSDSTLTALAVASVRQRDSECGVPADGRKNPDGTLSSSQYEFS